MPTVILVEFWIDVEITTPRGFRHGGFYRELHKGNPVFELFEFGRPAMRPQKGPAFRQVLFLMERNYISKGERREHRRWRIQRPERVAAVDKIEEMRKSEDFIGYRNRGQYNNAKGVVHLNGTRVFVYKKEPT